jgi:hypothetical protein
MVHLNVILPSFCKSSKWLFPKRLTNKSSIRIYFLSILATLLLDCALPVKLGDLYKQQNSSFCSRHILIGSFFRRSLIQIDLWCCSKIHNLHSSLKMTIILDIIHSLEFFKQIFWKWTLPSLSIRNERFLRGWKPNTKLTRLAISNGRNWVGTLLFLRPAKETPSFRNIVFEKTLCGLSFTTLSVARLYSVEWWDDEFENSLGSSIAACAWRDFEQEVLGRTNRLLSSIPHWPHTKLCVQQFFYCCLCILYRGNVFTQPLPSNDRGYAYRHTLMGRIYEVRRWDALRCCYMRTKFHRDWFRHSKVDRRRYTDT